MSDYPRTKVLESILQLGTACPHDNCNPSFCPLFELRKLPPAERIDWFHQLPDADLQYLTNYHQICLQWRSTEPNPVEQPLATGCRDD